MKSLFLAAALCLGCIVANAQKETGYAEPALRSPIVAVEFTGQRCRYCPNMSRDLQRRQNEYGKENYLIAALHHLTDYSLLPGNNVSLYNEEAGNYAKSLNVHSGLPFNYYNTLGAKESDLPLDEMFLEDDLLECKGTVFFNDNKEYVINVKTRLRSNSKDAVKGKKIDILFWALENNIVAFQDDNGKYTYPAHNHIFRGSVNGTWGEPYEIGSEYTKVLPIPSTVIEAGDTEVLVFFLDHETRAILDAGSFDVLPEKPSGIGEIVADDNGKAPVYDLNGVRVNRMVKGEIYVKKGKKFIVR